MKCLMAKIYGKDNFLVSQNHILSKRRAKAKVEAKIRAKAAYRFQMVVQSSLGRTRISLSAWSWTLELAGQTSRQARVACMDIMSVGRWIATVMSHTTSALMWGAPDQVQQTVSPIAVQYLLNFVLSQVTCHQQCVRLDSLHTALTMSTIVINLRLLWFCQISPKSTLNRLPWTWFDNFDPSEFPWAFLVALVHVQGIANCRSACGVNTVHHHLWGQQSTWWVYHILLASI